MWLLLLGPPVNAAEPASGASASLTSAAAAELLSVGRAWELALEANLELSQQRLALRSARSGVAEAAGGWEPSLFVGADVSRSATTLAAEGLRDETGRFGWSTGLQQPLPTGGELGLAWTETRDTGGGAASTRLQSDGVSLTVSQPLLDGLGPGPALAGLRQARRQERGERLALRSRTEDLLISVSDAYWELLVARESLSLARRSAEVAEAQQGETEERYHEGFAALGDLLQVRRAVGVARQAVVVAETSQEDAETRLCRLLGRSVSACPDWTLIDRPVVPEGEVPLDVALQRALGGNTRILQDTLQIEAVEDALRVARNAALPDLSVSGSVDSSGLSTDSDTARRDALSGQSTGWSVGLGLSVPIPGRAPVNSARQAKLAVEQARIGHEAALQDLEVEVREALRGLQRDRSRVELARQTVEAATQALEMDQELFREGRTSSRDVILSLESLDEAQASRLQAEVDLQRSMLRLERVQGVLLQRVAGAEP
jgi:outer membrane protein